MRLSKVKFLILLSLQVACSNHTDVAVYESVYTVDVTIPDYNPGNSEHFLISSVSDWSHINDADKRFFYVMPHVGYDTVTITACGTASEKRYITLHNGNDTHPAKLSVAGQANVRLIFDNARYWVADRMSSINHLAIGYFFIVKNQSQNIVFNRFHLTNFFDGIILQEIQTTPYTDSITIQNSRFDRMTAAGINADRVAILLSGEPWDDAYTNNPRNIILPGVVTNASSPHANNRYVVSLAGLPYYWQIVKKMQWGQLLARYGNYVLMPSEPRVNPFIR